jgi:hypothetical protein
VSPPRFFGGLLAPETGAGFAQNPCGIWFRQKPPVFLRKDHRCVGPKSCDSLLEAVGEQRFCRESCDSVLGDGQRCSETAALCRDVANVLRQKHGVQRIHYLSEGSRQEEKHVPESGDPRSSNCEPRMVTPCINLRALDRGRGFWSF